MGESTQSLDDRKLREVKADRRVAAAAVKRLMNNAETVKVTKARIPELEFERELLLVAYQHLMKPAMLSPAEKREKKEEEIVLRLIEEELTSLQDEERLTK